MFPATVRGEVIPNTCPSVGFVATVKEGHQAHAAALLAASPAADELEGGSLRRKPLLIRAVGLAISMDMKKPSLAFHWGVNQGGLLQIAKVRA